ncbi:Panacea domain-containing protein [Corynebacterium sp. HMSC05E07]|uniref:Panacea domain-containing protein n=1 Tax=Corynebacterium sp. HMSC05E07 TaxID=1581117 RepID=UPI0008A43C22|nr:Panacea domain-containing protein [Corynebacterium sp. HMSC05E07]OFT59928.1 hypothetical protein HMPREF3149_09035 [Corynebacterium sp. HMSC05E07]
MCNNIVKAITLHILQRSAELGYEVTRTKLQKLLYFADLNAVDRIGRTITGIDWMWHNYGPYSPAVTEVEKALVDEGVISSQAVIYPVGYVGHRLAIRYSSMAIDSDEYINSVLGEIVEKVLTELGSLNATQVAEKSYATPPMQLAQSHSGRRDVHLDMSLGTKEPSPRSRRSAAKKRIAQARQRKLSDSRVRHDHGDLQGLRAELSAFSSSIGDANKRLLY